MTFGGEFVFSAWVRDAPLSWDEAGDLERERASGRSRVGGVEAAPGFFGSGCYLLAGD